MKTYKLDFNLEAWISELEIDADSVEEAKEKLYRMTLEEILEEGGLVESTDVSDIDCEVISADYKIHISNIKYDTTDDTFKDSLEETGFTEEELIRTLPTELDVEISWHTWDDIGDLLDDAIIDETGFASQGYIYTILNR